jgi:hypothetical protein
VLVQSSKHRSQHAAWVPQFRTLFAALEQHWRGRFELLVVRLQREGKFTGLAQNSGQL